MNATTHTFRGTPATIGQVIAWPQYQPGFDYGEEPVVIGWNETTLTTEILEKLPADFRESDLRSLLTPANGY